MRRRFAAGLYVLCAACTVDTPDAQEPDTLTENDEVKVDTATQRWLRHGDKKPKKPGHWWHPHPKPPSDPDCEEPMQPEPPAQCGWKAFSDGLSGANIADAMFDPRAPGTVYALAGSLLWKSQDSGRSWQQHGRLTLGGFSQLIPDGADPQRLLASTTSGISRSEDGGKTWTNISLAGLAMSAIGSSPVEPRRVYVASSNAGVFRSDDGGGTFGPPGFSYPDGLTIGLSVSPEDSLQLVTAVWDIGVEGGLIGSGSLQRSNDGGATWTTTLEVPGEVGELARCPVDPNVLIAGTVEGVALSTDGGSTWVTRRFDGPYPRGTAVVFGASSCDVFYAVQYGAGPRLTTDGGLSFGPPLLTGVPNGRVGGGVLAVHPNDDARLVLGTYGGVFVSSDSGARFSAADGIRDFIVSGLSSSPQDPSRLWLGSWGPGAWTRASESEPWRRLPSANLDVDYVINVATDPYRAGRTLVGGTYAWLSNPDDPLTFTRTEAAFNATTFEFDAHDANVLYVGTQVSGVLRSADGGQSFASINGNLQPWPTPNGTFVDVRDILVAANDPATLYLATFGRGVYKSTDTGGSWTRAYTEDAEVYCLVADAAVPDRLYACANGIQRSDDGGATWQDDSAGLTTLMVRGLVHDPVSGFRYATSNHGVFVQRQLGGAWQGVERDCLPSAGTPTLTRDGGKRYLVVSAGAGVYRRAL